MAGSFCGDVVRAQEAPLPVTVQEFGWGAESSVIYDNGLEDNMYCIKDEPIDILWEAGEDQVNDFIVGPSSIEVTEDDYVPPTSPEESTEGFTKTRRVPFMYRANSKFVVKTEAVDDSNVVMFCMICGDRAPYVG